MMKWLETHAGPHPSFPFIYDVLYSGQFGVQSPSPPPWILMPFSMPLGNHTFELLQPTKSYRYGFFHLECVFSSFSHPARLYSNKLLFVKSFPAPPKNESSVLCSPEPMATTSLLNLVMLPWD